MKWKGARQSDNFKDRRGSSTTGKVALGGIGGVVILLLGLFFGGDPGELLQQVQMGGLGTQESQQPVEISTEEAELTEFARVILGSTEEVWGKIYKDAGLSSYRPSILSVFRDRVDSEGCGVGLAQYGPFYCPANEEVFLDLSFNEELKNKFGVQGEFALAYVIAHEIGHHVQMQQGSLTQVQAMRGKISEAKFNKLMVQLELQADFYAGIWAHYASRYSGVELSLEDIMQGMKAASAVGDDAIQMQAQGYVVPESFTHGTSEQRAFWFRKGYETGDVRKGDTFNDPSLQ
jgi:predicted metalloprotease